MRAAASQARGRDPKLVTNKNPADGCWMDAHPLSLSSRSFDAEPIFGSLRRPVREAPRNESASCTRSGRVQAVERSRVTRRRAAPTFGSFVFRLPLDISNGRMAQRWRFINLDKRIALPARKYDYDMTLSLHDYFAPELVHRFVPLTDLQLDT